MTSQDPTHSDPGRNNHRAREALPPIRTVLASELTLELPPRPSSTSSPSASSLGSALPFWERSSSASSGSKSSDSRTRARASTISSHHLSPHTESHSPPLKTAHSLPPSPLSVGQPSHQYGSSFTDPLAAQQSQPPAAPPSSAPPYSYNILRPSPSGGLITSPPSSRRKIQRTSQPASTPRPSTDAEPSSSTSTRRHVCTVCNKRFNRPSSLRTHESVHTGSKPFACLHPGCTKAFSVASNMRRHLRTHGYAPAELELEEQNVADSEGEDDTSEAGLREDAAGPSAQFYEWSAGRRPDHPRPESYP